MEMHQIRYFLAVSKSLNFTRAAEECHVAQPSLSRAVRKLEEELGGDLFRRERGQTHLTDLGRKMQPLLRQAYESAAEAKEQAAKYQSTELSPLRVGLSKTFPMDLIMPSLAELARALPGLDLLMMRADAGGILGALKAGDIELGIAATIIGADWDRLDRWHLFEEGFVLIGSPEPVDARLPLSALAGLSLIKRPYCENRPAFEEVLAAQGIAMVNQHEVSGDDDVDTLVGGRLGVALMPASAARASGYPMTVVEDLNVTRTVEVYGVFGRQRSVAASSLVKLLRAADWSMEAPDYSLS